MRICFFDIETTNLNAFMGRVLTCGFLDLNAKEPYVFRGDEPKYKSRSQLDDSKLVKAIKEELSTYNMIVGWNSKLFDVPFINARLAKSDQQPVKSQFHLDLMYYSTGAAMRIGSRKLDNVSKFLLPNEEQKTAISWEDWGLAGIGDKKGMDQVVKHNLADLIVTRNVYWKLLPYVANIHR
jgi:uncharacterized protein YprB with RNaseH-like and TPR domain